MTSLAGKQSVGWHLCWGCLPKCQNTAAELPVYTNTASLRLGIDSVLSTRIDLTCNQHVHQLHHERGRLLDQSVYKELAADPAHNNIFAGSICPAAQYNAVHFHKSTWTKHHSYYERMGLSQPGGTGLV